MSAAAEPKVATVDIVEVFRARAAARALLWHAGDLELVEAVDALQSHAEASGLIDLLGQDQIQQILADAFRPYREASR
jgi:hypothetical protein